MSDYDPTIDQRAIALDTAYHVARERSPAFHDALDTDRILNDAHQFYAFLSGQSQVLEIKVSFDVEAVEGQIAEIVDNLNAAERLLTRPDEV